MRYALAIMVAFAWRIWQLLSPYDKRPGRKLDRGRHQGINELLPDTTLKGLLHQKRFHIIFSITYTAFPVVTTVTA